MDFFVSLDKIDEYCDKKGIDISEEDREVINSIFSQCDKKNLKNEELSEGDGLLDNYEYEEFISELKNNAKNIFDKLRSYFENVNNKKQSEDYADVTSDNFITIVEDSDKNLSTDIVNLHYFLKNIDDKYIFDIVEKVNEKRPGDIYSKTRGFFRKIAERIDDYDNHHPGDKQNIVQQIKDKIVSYKDSLISYAKLKGVKYTQDYEKRFDAALANNDIYDLSVAMDRLYERTLVTMKSLKDVTNGKKTIMEMKQPNGKIDTDFAQGISGDCWFLSCIKSITSNENALKLLNDKISVQNDGENIISVTVNIQGKDYVISYDELINANEYSTGDLDVRAVEIAANRFQLENGAQDISFGGLSEDGFDIIFGEDNIDTRNYYVDDKPEDVANYIKELQTSDCMSVIGTKSVFDDNEEYFGIDEDGNQVKIQYMHAYIATKADDKYVYLINPWESNKVIKFKLDKISNAFGMASIIEIKNHSNVKANNGQQEKIQNNYYTSKNTYTKTIKENEIVVINSNTNEKTVIDINTLLAPFDQEEKDKIYNVLKDLPAEVLMDISKEAVFSNNKVRGKGVAGSQNPISGKINLKGSSIRAETIVHELGHALDARSSGALGGIFNSPYATAKNKKYRKTFAAELKAYVKAGNRMFDAGSKKTQRTKDGDRNYCTRNMQEMFAECYTLSMLGNCQSRQVIEKYFPKTLACAQEIIEETRLLDDNKRR